MRLFWRRAIAITGMTAAGQLALVAVSPLIARLYTPADLGSYAVALAIATICGSIGSLRYSLAQTTAEADADADDLLSASIGLLVLITPLALIAAGVTARIAAHGGGAVLDERLIWSVPAAYLSMGLFEILVFRSIRLRDFRALSVAKFLMPVCVAIFQVAGGLLQAGAGGLMAATVLGNILAGLFLLPRALRGLRFPKPIRAYRDLLLRFKRFPMFSAPTVLVETSANQLVPVLLLGFYGQSVAGQYALVHRVLKQPTALLGMSLSHAFLAEVGGSHGLSGPELGRFAVSTLKKLFLAVILPAAVGAMLAPWLFSGLFGEQWALAGRFAQILMPVYLALFLYSPFHQALTVHEKQHLNLLVEGLRLVAVVGLLALGVLAQLGIRGALGLFSAGVTASYAIGIALTVHILRKGQER